MDKNDLSTGDVVRVVDDCLPRGFPRNTRVVVTRVAAIHGRPYSAYRVGLRATGGYLRHFETLSLAGPRVALVDEAGYTVRVDREQTT